jgi:hypothetical protein
MAVGADEMNQERRVLRSSRKRCLLFFVPSAGAAVVGALSIREDGAAAWAVFVLSTLASLVFLFMLIWPNRLEISATGIETVTLGRRWSADWSQCSGFRVRETHDEWGPVSKVVVFDCTGPACSGRLARFSKELTGANSAIPENYGMKARELAALLNSYREASGEPPPPPRKSSITWLLRRLGRNRSPE